MEGETKNDHIVSASRAHRFFVGLTWLRIKLAIKPAIAVTIALAIGQNSNVSTLESSTRYLSPIFAIIYMPNKTRIQMTQLALLGGMFICAVIPYTMLAFLCAKATRDTARDALQLQQYEEGLVSGMPTGPAAFYQGKAAAIAAVFIFILAWVANVLKTLFFPLIFVFVSGAIVGIVLLLEGLLFPEWTFFYSILEKVLYNALIGVAISFAVNTLIFPYNAREPFFRQTADFLDATERIISHHVKHFSSIHILAKEATEELENPVSSSHGAATDSQHSYTNGKDARQKDTNTKDEIDELQAMRGSITSLVSTLAASLPAAKREIAYGHLKVSDIKTMHQHCTALTTSVLACNLWSQLASSLRDDHRIRYEDRGDDFHGLLESLNATRLVSTRERKEERLKWFALMEEHIAPRIIEFSMSCTNAVDHIKKALELGIYQRAPFLVRSFITSPRAFNDDDLLFSDEFETTIKQFWTTKHATKATYLINDSSSAVNWLVLYMESVLHSMALRLLEFCRWADEVQASGTIRKNHLVLPTVSRFVKTVKKALLSFKHQSEPDTLDNHDTELSGLDETIENERHQKFGKADNYLSSVKPELTPRNSPVSNIIMFLYRVKVFIFDSKVGGFGLRAAIALTAAALPAFFPDSVAVFLRYRLLWIPLTVLLGLQPVLGKALASLLMRIVGTVVGGVLGLLVVEIGRVPGGMIPVFFVTVVPLFFVVQLNPLLFLPVLLCAITEVLIVGYKLTADTLGLETLASSGQEYLESPALMGYRILMTLAGIVVAFIFSIFPSLPTARSLLREDLAKHFVGSADMYQLQSLRTIGQKFELPPDLRLDKAVAQKQVELMRVSATTREYTGMTAFELSPRGVFPVNEWKRVLGSLDNLDTTLAVNNALYTQIRQADPEDAMGVSRVFVNLTSEQFFRLVLATLFSLGGSIARWRPLPPILTSPVEAHIKKQKALADAAKSYRQSRTATDLNPDVITHFGAYMVSNAILARCLEELVKDTEALVGQSKLQRFLLSHKRDPEVKAD